MPRPLFLLPEGSRFSLNGMPEVTGELVRASDCSCTVKVDGGKRNVRIEDDEGVVREFTANKSRTTTWAPSTLVDPIFIPDASAVEESKPKENVMSKKSTTKSAATTSPKAKKPKSEKAPKQPKAAKAPKAAKEKKAKAPKEPKAKKVSALDAAAQVLAKKGTPMNCKDLVQAMEASGLWKSPGGKTPHATLYSAIIREIKDKGKEARFRKTDAGTFEATSHATATAA